MTGVVRCRIVRVAGARLLLLCRRVVVVRTIKGVSSCRGLCVFPCVCMTICLVVWLVCVVIGSMVILFVCLLSLTRTWLSVLVWRTSASALFGCSWCRVVLT